jgi:predicted small secreted protein
VGVYFNKFKGGNKMKRSKIIFAVLILSIVSLVLSGCGGTGGGFVTPSQDDIQDDIQTEEENFDISSNEGGSFKLSDGAEIGILPNSISGDTGIKFSKIIYDFNKDRGTEE